jgi:uncharacterized protein (TIGR02246 family)
MPTEDETAVRAAVDQWFDVLNAMLNGDAEPLAALYSHKDDVTYMGAEGSYRIGWSAAFADWKAQAAKSSGGTVEGRDIHVVVAGDMATATHYTIGNVRNSEGEAAQTSVRETSVFRKEDGGWRMIGHHADPLPDLVKAFAG